MSKKIADFSHHQGTVDWKKAKDELEVAVIRVQYGSKVVDDKYKEYVAGCKANKIPFGHYAYGQFVSESDAIQEAKDFLSRADKDAQFLVVDVEEVTTKKASDLVPATQAFIDHLKKNSGKKVGLYTGNSFYTEHGMDKVKADFLWIPRYPSNDTGLLKDAVKPTVKGVHLHQYTQCGKLAGVKGNIDLNQIVGDKELEFFSGQAVQEVVKPTPAPKPAPAKPAVKPAPAKKPVAKPIPAKPVDNVYGTVTVNCAKLNLHGKADLNSPAKEVAEKGDSFKAYGMKNGLYILGGGLFITSSSHYVKFVKNPHFGK
ncbi:GH25 family lysozyme [Priestia megaterium]|uniref:GH25 family lysozyme n=1 Tax=Priestia megaterium TaxID=1404 RepID=UPI0030001133